MNPVEKEKTLMSTTGKTNNRNYRKLLNENKKGFTLIELTVVIFIAGILLSITVPTIRDSFLHDNLKTVSRKVVATITWLRNKSVSEYNDHILFFDIESGKYWHETEGMDDSELLIVREQANTMPEDVHILDIKLYGTEKYTSGEIGIRFSKKGYIRYSLIHLTDDDERKFTLLIEPFLGKVKIMEDYLDFEDLLSKDI